MIKIRVARKADAREIAEVHVRAWQETYDGIFPSEYLASLSIAEREAQWKEKIEDLTEFSHDKMVLVAEDTAQKRIAGFIHVGRSATDDESSDSAINALYVLLEYQHRGIGRDLCFHALEWLQSQGYKRAKLWVVESNSAREFYSRMGATLTNDIAQPRIGGKEVTKVSYLFHLDRWGKASELKRMRWIVAGLCLPSPIIVEGLAHLVGRQHGNGYRDEVYDVLVTVPSMLILPTLWIVLSSFASPKSTLGVDSFKYWERGGIITVTMTYLFQLMLRSPLVSEYTHPDVLLYFYPTVLAVTWVIIALYSYLIRLLFRRNLCE